MQFIYFVIFQLCSQYFLMYKYKVCTIVVNTKYEVAALIPQQDI